MLTLLIARHGNTFDPGETLLRVGRRTDLPLSKSGQVQAKKLGEFLEQNYPYINRVWVSSLRRTQETASFAVPQLSFEMHPIFDEIDYGEDDGKPEAEVMQRLGQEALNRWEEENIPPPGWNVDPNTIIQNWKNFAQKITDKTTLVITSNGIARFAPYILDTMSEFRLQYQNKMKTGAISALEFQNNQWQVKYWNKLP